VRLRRSAEQLLHIVQRKGLEVDPKDPLVNAQNRAWFCLYADKFLQKAAGTNRWSGSIRHYQTISGAQLPPSCEAFVILCMENDCHKWKMQEDILAGTVQTVEFDPEKEEKDQTKEWKAQDKALQSKYSDAKSGQNKFGGWREEGRTRFNVLVKKITAARQKDHNEEVETQCLADLQVQYKIQEMLAKRKGKKRKAKNQPAEIVEVDLSDSDEETVGEEAAV
jgi:hypothetical protein